MTNNEIILASGILILFGILNIMGVKKAGFIQTVLSTLLIICVATLFISTLLSAKAKLSNMYPIWGFDKAKSIIQLLTKAKVDVIEVGFLRNVVLMANSVVLKVYSRKQMESFMEPVICPVNEQDKWFENDSVNYFIPCFNEIYKEK